MLIRNSFTLIVILILSVIRLNGQTEFPLGVYIDERNDDSIFEKAGNMGANYLHAYSHLNNYNRLKDFKLLATKEDSEEDYPFFYARGMYSKWESERDQENTLATGIKHTSGEAVTYNGAGCWTNGNSQPGPIYNLVYGPDYRQDKNYRLAYNMSEVFYTVKFRIAYNPDIWIPIPNDPVCRISVNYRFRILEDGVHIGDDEELFTDAVLTVSDFPTTGFHEFTLSYSYSQTYIDGSTVSYHKSGIAPPGIAYDDGYPGKGIQFNVDWLGSGNIYVDYVEVYDNYIWGENFIGDSSDIALSVNKIINYSNDYSSWDFLRYWYTTDEPQTIDYYTPIRTVDSILRNYTDLGKGIITAFDPSWNGTLNGDNKIQKFVDLVNPQQLMIDYYPYYIDKTDAQGLELLRGRLNEAHNAQKDFWYTAQSFGERLGGPTGDFCQWRKPNAEQMRASVMLALAHGIKGLLFWKFDDGYTTNEINCGLGTTVYFDVILDENDNPTDLYYEIQENIAPRLSGTLGNTLLNLNYTGEYTYRKHEGSEVNLEESENILYITLDESSLQNVNFHAGILRDKNDSENNYFLLTNLVTEGSRSVFVNLVKSGSQLGLNNYYNIRVKEVEEGTIDETFNTTTFFEVELSAGEGKLFQIAPVVKYGGELITNETISASISLFDEMKITNSSSLHLNADYEIKANINVESGCSVTVGQNGTINLLNGAYFLFSSWSESLLMSRNGTHPKIVWGKYPGNYDIINYYVWKKIGNGSWALLATLNGNVYSYTDYEEELFFGPPQTNGATVYYYIKVSYPAGERNQVETSNASNTVTARIEGETPQKQGSEALKVYTYDLEQNYPNPFNPSTEIR